MAEAKEKPKPTYKVVRFEAENVKRLYAVEIKPDGSVIEITGDNENGKTSLLDSLYWAFSGTKPIQDEPIREGAEKAHVNVDLMSSLGTKLMIRRTFTRKEGGGFNTNLVIENEEGMRPTKPQDTLNALIGAISFDPLEFTRMKPIDRINILKGFVKDFDFAAVQAAIDKDFAERTIVNRDIENKEAIAGSIIVPDGTPDEPIDESALIAEMRKAGEHNTDVSERRTNRQAATIKISDLRTEARNIDAEIEELQRQIETRRSRQTQLNADADSLSKKLQEAGELPEPIDVSDIEAKIAEARSINQAVETKRRKAAVEAEAIALIEKAAALTKAINERKDSMREAVAKAEMPVDGIGMGDTDVTIKGKPFDQASGAEQLRAAIGIAVAANPRLRVIRVLDGALLGKKSFAMITEMAQKLDIQVWVETVESPRATAIVIEDGRIKGAPVTATE